METSLFIPSDTRRASNCIQANTFSVQPSWMYPDGPVDLRAISTAGVLFDLSVVPSATAHEQVSISGVRVAEDRIVGLSDEAKAKIERQLWIEPSVAMPPCMCFLVSDLDERCNVYEFPVTINMDVNSLYMLPHFVDELKAAEKQQAWTEDVMSKALPERLPGQPSSVIAKYTQAIERISPPICLRCCGSTFQLGMLSIIDWVSGRAVGRLSVYSDREALEIGSKLRVPILGDGIEREVNFGVIERFG